MKYVCMVRSSFLPDESNINAKGVCFNPRFFNNRVDDILTGKDDGFQPNWMMLRSDRMMTGFCAWIVRGLNRNDTGGSFLFVQTFSGDTNCEINSERRDGVIWPES